MFDKFLSWFSVDMGIDLGTCNTLVCVRGEGIVLDEPSVVAVKRNTNRVLNNGNAVGFSAKEMLGKTPGSITAIRPLKDGVISDFEITEAMLSYFIRKVSGRGRVIGPRVVIAVPSGITEVEKRAVLDSAERAGARRVYLVEEPMAAGIGAGLPIVEPTASMVVDIGGGTTEIAILSLNGVVYAESVKIGGDKMDEAITSWVRRNYGCVIGESTSEKIKKTVGCATDDSEKTEMTVTGRNLAEGIPESFTLNSQQVFEAMKDPLFGMVRAIRNALELSPPELAADIAERGIVLTGGGAMLRDLDKLISNSTGIPVIIAEDPLTCVARGGGQALEIIDKYNIDLLSTE